MRNIITKLLLLGFVAVYLSGCSKDDMQVDVSGNSQLKQDSYVALSWYQLMLNLIKETPGHTPPIVARSLGYTGVTLYESLVGGMLQHNSLAGQLQDFRYIPKRKYGDAYSATIISNAALAGIIRHLFANASSANKSRIDSLESANNNTYAKTVNQGIFDRSRDYGHAVADAIYNWSLTDGGNQAYLNNFPSGYTYPVGTGNWIPTLPLNQNAMLPYWGNNRAMVPANSSSSIDPPLPPVFSTIQGTLFHNAALEVYNSSLQLSPAQNTIARYWNDGGGSITPPGHNMSIAIQLIREKKLDLSNAAITLAKLGIAENDAAIVCWKAKFSSNVLRPITYIRAYIDPNWVSLITTPPFPSYTSGHSTFSNAAATILTAEIGDNIPFTDSSKIRDGFLPRSFSSFYKAAEEAAASRLYGGIHYGFDNLNGLMCGKLIAENVLQLNW